jgi:probable rRNA maturation factor
MIEINNFTKFVVDKKYFGGVAKSVLKGENRETENLFVCFVSPSEIKKINKKYRNKNKPTDVLSFGKPINKDKFILSSEALLNKIWSNEIIICPAIVSKKSINSTLSLKINLADVLIHGILHCFGYDHEKSEKEAIKMEKKQEYYLSTFKRKINNL